MTGPAQSSPSSSMAAAMERQALNIAVEVNHIVIPATDHRATALNER